MNFWVKKQGAHPRRSKVKAPTGLQQRGSCFSSRQREESKAQPQHFIYQTSLSHIKLHFCRVCISLPRSQGWKHPSEKCPRRQREAQRYFSITGGVSRLQHNFPLLPLLPYSAACCLPAQRAAFPSDPWWDAQLLLPLPVPLLLEGRDHTPLCLVFGRSLPKGNMGDRERGRIGCLYWFM